MCGSAVSASASECPGCGEPFSPLPNGDSELTVETTEEYEPADELKVPESGKCEECGEKLSVEGICPKCSQEEISEGKDGCPVCGNKSYSIQSGDLVSCVGCGNVYVREPFTPAEQNWKWKFWVGLIFILVGNVGVALGSYIHNVLRWSPLGAMYLGYGWFDQLVGAIGIVLFILGLLLFAWSFKREREVTCPNCKVTVRESQLSVYEPEEEEEVPESLAVKSALDEIGETAECPSCGTSVSIFDTVCGNCGAVFDMEVAPVSESDDLPELKEDSKPGRRYSASELDEDEMVMSSLELEAPEDEIELNGNGLKALSELETAFEESLSEKSTGVSCPTCGAIVGRGLDTCPGCGETIPPQKMKGGE